MYKYPVISTLLLISLLLPTASFAQDAEDWQIIRQTSGVTVYKRKNADSPVMEVKVEMIMHTTLDALVAVIRDPADQPNWVYSNKRAEELAQYGKFSWMMYAYSNAPWPVSDRDMVLLAKLSQDSLTRIIKNEAECRPDFIPETDGVVRIQNCHTIWTIKPLDKGEIFVSLELHVDLGGSIPSWLLNLVIANGPYHTILNLKTEVNKPKYKNAVIDYIID